MAAALPATKPRVTREQLMSEIRRKHPAFTPGELMIVGVRGYYRDTLGAVGRNDRAMYDDALFVVTPDAFVAFNGNTDPSGYRKGAGTGGGKGMASLNPGVWPVYRLDLHQGKYLAVCQRAGPVTVTRDGTPPYEDRGMFGINIHKGGINGTSSEGCQTVPAAQWPAFIALVTDQAKRLFGADWRSETLTYVLLDGGGGVSEPRQKTCYVGVPAIFELSLACHLLIQAFGGHTIYHVGSSRERPDWRDVDLVMIMPDEVFAAEFPGAPLHSAAWELTPKWLIMTCALSKWLTEKAGVLVDFKFQPETFANERHDRPRNPIGRMLDVVAV